MRKAESIKSRLKNLAIEDGTTMQDKLITYALERSIYRLSVSRYVDRFTLKGGIFLYALFDTEFPRATVDIDFLAQKLSNSSEKIEEIFREIFSIEYDDAIRYDIESMQVRSITELKKYSGVKVTINSYLDRTVIPVSIDIGFGDIVYPERMQMEFPALLDMDEPKIYTYSIYSVIAEKFEACVSLGLANSRYKDFYDIFLLAKNFDISGTKLQAAIKETFSNRGTDYNDIVVFEEVFLKDATHQKRWDSFVKKKKAMENVPYEVAVLTLKRLIEPVVIAIREGFEFSKKWVAGDMMWE